MNNIRARLASADAFVVVTPEYNHGYPGALKLLIDSASREWHAKPVAFVSYGGISGGLRAVEQLRLVFAELHATTIRDSVSFANVWELFNSAGQPPPSAHKAMSALLRQLSWWAHALRDAREAGAYMPARHRSGDRPLLPPPPTCREVPVGLPFMPAMEPAPAMDRLGWQARPLARTLVKPSKNASKSMPIFASLSLDR